MMSFGVVPLVGNSSFLVFIDCTPLRKKSFHVLVANTINDNILLYMVVVQYMLHHFLT